LSSPTNTHLRVGHGIEFSRYRSHTKEESFDSWQKLQSDQNIPATSFKTVATELVLTAFTQLKINKIPFEICPTSNFDLLTCDIRPLKDLVSMRLVVSTDNDGIFFIEHEARGKTYGSVAGQ